METGNKHSAYLLACLTLSLALTACGRSDNPVAETPGECTSCDNDKRPFANLTEEASGQIYSFYSADNVELKLKFYSATDQEVRQQAIVIGDGDRDRGENTRQGQLALDVQLDIRSLSLTCNEMHSSWLATWYSTYVVPGRYQSSRVIRKADLISENTFKGGSVEFDYWKPSWMGWEQKVLKLTFDTITVDDKGGMTGWVTFEEGLACSNSLRMEPIVPLRAFDSAAL